jgi:hypothetical protein
LIDSTIAFLSAFGIEALLFSDELWTRLTVGVVLVIIILLTFWCVSTTLEAKTGFSLLHGIRGSKDGLVGFTRGVSGKTSESLKGAFNRLRPRRQRASTSATLVNPTWATSYGPQTAVEMDEIGNKMSGSAV